MIFPFVKACCTGNGYDITYASHGEQLDGATLVHPSCIPDEPVDYIFSDAIAFDSKWNQTVALWLSRIRVGGVLALYVSDDKSILYFLEAEPLYHIDPSQLEQVLWKCGCSHVFRSESDLNHGILVVAKK